MSRDALYVVDPNRTSGGRYHRVTTSLEYVLLGIDLARAKPERNNECRNEKFCEVRTTGYVVQEIMTSLCQISQAMNVDCW